MPDQFLPFRSAEELTERHDQKTGQVEAMDVAREIVNDVRANGAAAVRTYAARFDKLQASDQLFYDRSDMREAWDRTPDADKIRLERITRRIRVFAEVQRKAIGDVSIDIAGGRAGHHVRPLQRAGCYAPAGTYPLPSTVLMTCVTARTAGVSEIWIASPSPSRVMLAASHVGGADGFLAAGGAQAIGALAYGADVLPPCDVVVGPGNRYVTAAKRLVAGDVAIDMAAGPSELVIIADGTAQAKLVAADLLGQAEHDADAWPVLLTTSSHLVADVQRELSLQLKNLPTASLAKIALSNGGTCVLDNLQTAIALSDKLAPEHVQVCTENPDAIANSLSNYGAVFIGEQTPEVLGDYGMGPNHVLPTSGVARSFGGLSVFTFLRVNTWLKAPQRCDDTLRDDVLWLARTEGLEAHARAIEARQ